MSFQRGPPFNNASVSSFSRPSYTAGAGQGFGNRKISQTKLGRENLNPSYYQEQNSYSPGRGINRPTSRQPARDSRQYFNRPNQSRMSSSSEQSRNLAAMLNDGEIFPQDLLFLLSEEERNIISFKDRIEKEKMKLENDFTNFKNQIEHIIQDLKISLQAELDNVYRFFIEKYANLKSEVQEVRHIRKEIEAQNRGNDFGAFINATSNKELVKELERDAEHYKIYRMQNYITEMQKKKINPLLDLSKQIILLGTSSNNYYNADSTLKQLNELKNNFSHFTKHMFGALGQYVISPQFIIEDNLAAEDMRSDAGHGDDDFQVPTRNTKKEFYDSGPEPYPGGDRYEDEGRQRAPNASVPAFRPSQAADRNIDRYERQPERQQERPPERALERPPTLMDRQPQRPAYQHAPAPKKQFTISQSQQIVTSGWVEDLGLRPLATIRPEHSDIVLCAILVNGKFIVTGGKDSNLNVYTIDGARVTTLKGHQASICSLAIINDPNEGTLLASGSDYGCSSLIVWTTSNWSMRMKIQAHTAAVTSIVDLCDGQTLVSGSYDKKINIYSYRKDAVLYNLPNNRASVTGIILNSSRNKMISCGLDNCLYVWNITRRQDNNGTVESITLDKTIQNNQMICSLNCSQLRSDVVVAGTKDGKIKFWNLSTGELEKTLTANNSAIIELVVIERQSKPNFPIILSCSSRDKALVMTRTDSGLSSLFEVNDKLNIEFGCGIGPKIIFDNSRWSLVMALVSQVAERKQVNLFEVELK